MLAALELNMYLKGVLIRAIKTKNTSYGTWLLEYNGTLKEELQISDHSWSYISYLGIRYTGNLRFIRQLIQYIIKYNAAGVKNEDWASMLVSLVTNLSRLNGNKQPVNNAFNQEPKLLQEVWQLVPTTVTLSVTEWARILSSVFFFLKPNKIVEFMDCYVPDYVLDKFGDKEWNEVAAGIILFHDNSLDANLYERCNMALDILISKYMPKNVSVDYDYLRKIRKLFSKAVRGNVRCLGDITSIFGDDVKKIAAGDWQTIVSIAIYSKNIQLYKDVIELCKQNSIDVSNFSWSCLLGDKITLFYDVVRDELTQYISNAYNLASLLQVTLEANNFKLFKRIYNSNNGDKCSIYDKKRWLCAAVTNFELFEKLRRDSILTLKISAVMWKDIIERIIIQGGIDQLLAFAIFSKEQGYFVATGLSDKILVAAKMAPKGYMYLKKFDSFGVPNDISNLIFAYVELPYYRNAAAYKHYFGKESVCSEESIKDLDFLEFDDYMPQVRHQYQDLTLMPPAKNNESDKVCTVVALQQTTRLNPYVID